MSNAIKIETVKSVWISEKLQEYKGRRATIVITENNSAILHLPNKPKLLYKSRYLAVMHANCGAFTLKPNSLYKTVTFLENNYVRLNMSDVKPNGKYFKNERRQKLASL